MHPASQGGHLEGSAETCRLVEVLKTRESVFGMYLPLFTISSCAISARTLGERLFRESWNLRNPFVECQEPIPASTTLDGRV